MSTVILACVVEAASLMAQSQDEEALQTPSEEEFVQAVETQPPVDAPFLLEPEPYFSCENGQCTSGYRDTWSNFPPEEVERQRQLMRPERENVTSQLAGLTSINEATSQALEVADAMTDAGAGSELLDVTVYLEERPFDFGRLRPLRGPDRQSAFQEVVDERRAQVRPDQEYVRGAIERAGGAFGGGRILSNNLTARVPAAKLPGIVGVAPVVGVELVGETKPDADGAQRRLALGWPAAGVAGRTGQQGTTRRSSGTEVKFGIVESNNSLNTSHVSWLDAPGQPSRITETDRCEWEYLWRECDGSATTTKATHGTWVTSILLGSIEQGQDPAIGDTQERQRRSGIAKEAVAHYYSIDGTADVVDAVEKATLVNGVDIINISLQPTDDWCNNGSIDGVRGAVQAAEDAGVLTVVTAGNDAVKRDGSCSVSSFGAFPDTLTVGATNNVTELASMDTVSLWSGSGRGTVSKTLAGGRAVSTRMVDLIVTGRPKLMADAGTDGYSVDATIVGTSFAAPQVAGMAAIVKDWLHDRGGLGGRETDPYVIRNLLSVMGDGSSSTSGGGIGYSSTVSDHSGFGHLRFVDLDTELGSGGAWGQQRRVVSAGQVIQWPVGGTGAESSAVKGWKFAALWDVNTYDGSPDIKFELVDRCPAGGGEEIIKNATRHPLKARMRMRSSEMASLFHGRCLFLRATIEHATSSFTLYTADYFYTNSRINHDMP
ncbi:MAG: S8 family peptidase [Myxococcales bacterium]|nr:S8 family peptidase [Myxococcales bacterium]